VGHYTGFEMFRSGVAQIAPAPGPGRHRLSLWRSGAKARGPRTGPAFPPADPLWGGAAAASGASLVPPPRWPVSRGPAGSGSGIVVQVFGQCRSANRWMRHS